MSGKKKNIIFALTGALLSVALSGCSMSWGEGRKNDVSISVAWHTGKDARAAAPEQINEFRKVYGDIEVKPDTWIIDTSTYYMKAATGRLPTIFSMAMTEAERFKRSGFKIDLTEYMKKYGYDNYIRKEIKDVVSEGGEYYAVPYQAYLLGVVFNAELFEKAGLKNSDGTYKIPKTFDELAETAEIITEKTGVPGLLIETDKRVAGWLFTNIAWSYGVDFIRYEDGKWYSAFNTPECVNAFQYIKDLKWKYKVIPENYQCDQQQAQRRVVQGGCAMIIDGGVNSIFSTWGGDKNILGMFSLPEGPAGKTALLGGTIYGISNVASKEELDAAFKWLDYVNTAPLGKKGISLEKSVEEDYKNKYDKDMPIGLKGYSIWTEDCPRRIADEKMRQKYTNVPLELYKDYNDMIDGKIPVKIQPEEPVCCQDLYYVLTDCIKEIYSNPDVDLEQLAADAAQRFQTEYLDKIN